MEPKPPTFKPQNDGSGLQDHDVPCVTCNGKGRRLWSNAIDIRCPDCFGSGRVSDIKAGQMLRMHE